MSTPHTYSHAKYVSEQLVSQYPKILQVQSEFRGEITLFLSEAEKIREISLRLRDDFHFDYLLDISSVDHLEEEPRFEIVYEHYSVTYHSHLRLKCRVSEDSASLPTISDIYPTANWHEREIYDMMGIKFVNHPNLRRILMWEGYPYYPLRKDFPLEGVPFRMADGHFTDAAPLAGGPFVASSSDYAHEAEPRSRSTK